MPVSWRHRIVRVLDDDASVAHAVLGVVEDGWIFVARVPGDDPGTTDLVFRRALVDRQVHLAWS
jgi:hypothetical protein